MEKEKLVKAFEKKGYAVRYFDTAAQAADYLDGSIDGKSVGFGDSMTLKSMGLFERLATHNEVHSPMVEHRGGESFFEAAEKCMKTQVYIVSVNAATEKGEMINIDSYGNRVASSLYLHERVCFVFGINKIMPTLDEALWRVRNVAAPKNAKRLGYKTPCAIKADRCYDCNSPERICNAALLYLHRPEGPTAFEVVIIAEEMGL